MGKVVGIIFKVIGWVIIAMGVIALLGGITTDSVNNVIPGVIFFVVVGGVILLLAKRAGKKAEEEQPLNFTVPENIKVMKVNAEQIGDLIDKVGSIVNAADTADTAGSEVRQMICEGCGASIKVGPGINECEYCGSHINQG